MTVEEAIAYGNDYYIDLVSSCCEVDEKHKEFVRMSLKALEQTRWIPISEEMPQNAYTKEFLLSIDVDGEKAIIKGTLSLIADKDSDGNILKTCHDGFRTFYEPLVMIMPLYPYNFSREIPMKYIKAWMPLPQPYEVEPQERNDK